MFTSIGCNVCGKPVSKGFNAPDDLEIGGWIECRDCLLTKAPDIQNVAAILVARMMRPEFYGGSDLHKSKIIDAAARDIVVSLNNSRFKMGS
jgi:hypothetical protein